MIVAKEYGQLPDGQTAHLYTVVNSHGNKLTATNYGCRVVSLIVADKSGEYRDIVLGFDSLLDYVVDDNNIGLLSDYCEQKWREVLWDAHVEGQENGETIVFSCNQNGINAQVSYCFTEDNTIVITEKGVDSTGNQINFGQRLYFNLKGSEGLDGHTALIPDNQVVEPSKFVDDSPQFVSVQGRIDLRRAKTLKNIHKSIHPLVKKHNGIDLVYRLHKADELSYLGRVRAKLSGIKLEVYSTKQFVHFYTANNIKDIMGKGGAVYEGHNGFFLMPVDNSTEPKAHKTVYKLIIR